MKRYYCTYFDKNYLAKGMALIESLNSFEKNSFTLFILCLDNLTKEILTQLNYSYVQLISLNEIEKNDFALKKAKADRSKIEYCGTLTPSIILWILKNIPSLPLLTYLDADLFFYASPDPIFQEFEKHSILIHEHRFSPEQKYLERNGKYNVGLLCFKNDMSGLSALEWWRNKCNEWCYYRLEDAKFGDQLYLNQFPLRFQRVAILSNIGAGVAPWNHIQYEFCVNDHGIKCVNKTPLIFYHFHSLEIEKPEIIIPSKFFPTTPFTKDIITICFEPYAEKLYQNYQKLQELGINNIPGLNKTQLNIFLAHQSIISKIKTNKLFHIIPISNDWILYTNSTLRRNVHQVDKLLDEAENEQSKGNTVKALTLLLDIIRQHPNHPIALNDLGVIHWNIGDKHHGMHYMHRALHYAPSNKTIKNNVMRMNKLLNQ